MRGRCPRVHASAGSLLVWGLVASGCAGEATQRLVVTDARSLAEASGPPRIEAVVDLGGGDVSLDRPLDEVARDGVVLVGETLLIRGASFGRQPAVTVAERPAAVLARTADGGILLRVPSGVPAGARTLVVSHRGGRDSRPIEIHRYAGLLATRLGHIAWMDVRGDGLHAGPRTQVPGARWLSLSHDGRAAYVAGSDDGRLRVFELPAARGPRLVFELPIGPEPVSFMLAAERAPVLALIRPHALVLLDTSSALHPARRQPRALALDALGGAPVAAALSPDGRWLALAGGVGNRIVIIDTTFEGQGPVLELVPTARAPVLVDLAFAPAGDTLWVLAGETSASARLGPQPALVHAVRLEARAGALHAEPVRRVEIPDFVPVRLHAARYQPLASGAAVRLPPERTPVHLAGRDREGRAMVLRLAAEDRALPLAESALTIDALATEPQGRWLLAAGRDGSGRAHVLGLSPDGRGGVAPRPAMDVGAAGETTTLVVQP